MGNKKILDHSNCLIGLITNTMKIIALALVFCFLYNNEVVARPQQTIPPIYGWMLPGLAWNDAATRNWNEYWKYVYGANYAVSDAYQQAHNTWMNSLSQSGVYGNNIGAFARPGQATPQQPQPNPSPQQPQPNPTPQQPQPNPATQQPQPSPAPQQPQPNPTPQQPQPNPAPQQPQPNPTPQQPQPNPAPQEPNPAPQQPQPNPTPQQPQPDPAPQEPQPNPAPQQPQTS